MNGDGRERRGLEWGTCDENGELEIENKDGGLEIEDGD